MRGVSEVIAIILILMITISLAGLAYMFMSTTMSDTTTAASSTVSSTTNTMLKSFRVESIHDNTVYIRNTGTADLYNVSVYVNDTPVGFFGLAR
jgi:flagellin-like protein